MITRSYSEMLHFDSYEDRLVYLRLESVVGRSTFGFDRYLNQRFYTSREWKDIRNDVIVRDYGCDLGIRDREIPASLIIHHMNPIDVSDILDKGDWILNPDFLITTSHNTHNSIHYGVKSLSPPVVVERTPDDTTLW